MVQEADIYGYLGRALSFELSAVQQYLSLCSLMRIRGMPQAGEQFHHEAMQEMEHVERIIGRMLALGAAPNASMLRPVRLDGSLPQLMEYVSRLEAEIVEFYAQAVRHCSRTQDHENRMFFESLWDEERQHAGKIDTMRRSLGEGLPVGAP